MIDDILSRAGINARRGRFPSPPSGTYAVFFDDIETDGADPIGGHVPHIYRHNVTIELYEPQPDDMAETKIEGELDAAGLLWSKQDRYWLQDVQRYPVIYETNYTSKSK